MSIAKRIVALAAAGATAVVLGGVFGATRQATPVNAAFPLASALGCASSNNNLDIAFPTSLGSGIVSSSLQNTGGIPTPGAAPGSLAIINPASIVECGAAFQDTNVAVPVPPGAFTNTDGDPNSIDGGTITYTLASASLQPAFAPGAAQLLESNGTTVSINCGSTTPPVGTVAVVAGVAVPGTAVLTSQGGLESCQGAVPGFTPGTISPSAGNLVHVAFRPGVTFGLIGVAQPAVTISATYRRFPSLDNVLFASTTATPCTVAIAGCFITGTNGAVTTNSLTIPISQPTYYMSLTPSPSTIPAASGTGQGSTITAQLYHVSTVGCVPAALGSTAQAFFVVCPTQPFVNPAGTGTILATNTVAGLSGAEPGVVTFSTTSGVFGYPGALTASAQQTVSVHCGALAGYSPAITIPQLGGVYNFSFSNCQSVTATLYGGGNAGTATVTGVYVGDYTGGNAVAQTTVALSPTGNTVTLTRGCNEVITSAALAANTPVSTVVSSVTPSSAVVSVWRFDNSSHAFLAGYFNTAGAPTDFSTVGPNQSLFICVSGTATYPTGAF